MDFSFKDVTLKVKSKTKKRNLLLKIWAKISRIGPDPRHILDCVTGHVERGSMLAILGSSGSGKSSLLDVLAGRQRAGKATGKIYLDGSIIDVARMKEICGDFGYVMQDECFIPQLTVRETLVFAYALKRRVSVGSVPMGEIDAILKKLRLYRQAESYVG